MTRSLLLAALMALSLNAHAMSMLHPMHPMNPMGVMHQASRAEPIKTHKCNVVQPTKVPCKAPCSVCFKDDKQIPCKETK